MGTSILRPAALLGLLVLTGCAAPQDNRSWSTKRFASPEPADHARLIVPTDLVAADRALGSGGEAYRRDGQLGVGTLDGNLAVPLYVGEAAPSLDDARYLYLRTEHGRVLYFSDRSVGRGSRHWYRR